MTVARTFDLNLVRDIITSPEVYRHVSDDGSPNPEDFTPATDPRVIYLGIAEGGALDGVFILVPQNAATVEVHTCLRKPLWGAAIEATKQGIRWVWENTNFQRIVTNVPAPNRLAAKLSEKSGMEMYGVNKASFLKDGHLYDQVLFGISREAVCR